MNYNREQLYDLVWTKPLNTAAADCGITGPVLRQICLNYEVPLPWGGYKPGKERIVLPVGDDFELSAAIREAVNSLYFSGENTATFIFPRKLTASLIRSLSCSKYHYERLPVPWYASYATLGFWRACNPFV